MNLKRFFPLLLLVGLFLGGILFGQFPTTPSVPLVMDSTGTVSGSAAANGDLNIQGTSSSTRTSSYVNLQPNGGNVQIGVNGTAGYNCSVLMEQFLVGTPNFTLGLFITNGSWAMGDLNLEGNGTAFTLNDSAQTFNLTAANGLNLNSSSPVKKFLTNTATTWNPASLANGASEAKIAISFPGVAVGDVITASLSTITSPFWTVQAVCSATDLAEVRITNNTGGTVDLASGTLRLNCVKF